MDEASLVSDVVLHLSHRPILARELAAAVERGTRINPDLEHAVTGELEQLAATAGEDNAADFTGLLEAWQSWVAGHIGSSSLALSPEFGDETAPTP